jgi:hypothetical protein
VANEIYLIETASAPTIRTVSFSGTSWLIFRLNKRLWRERYAILHSYLLDNSLNHGWVNKF